jgi:hypothetical protein
VRFHYPLLLCAFCICANVFADDSQRILSFDSFIQIHEDGSMMVRETITMQVTADHSQWGISRDFPTRYSNQYGNQIQVDFAVQEILRDSKPVAYHLTDVDNGVRVDIGDKKEPLDSGLYTYQIAYITDRQLGSFQNRDELFWNVTGNAWDDTIEKATVAVNLPSSIPRADVQFNAFCGSIDNPETNYQTFWDSDLINFVVTRELKAKEGFTIVLSWPKGFIVRPTFSQKSTFFIINNIGLLVGLIGTIGLLFYYLSVWERVGKGPSKAEILPIYHPPNNLSPAAVRFVAKMEFDAKTFAAAIVSMAVKGYLTIQQTKNIFKLTLTKKSQILLSPEEKKIADKLFNDRVCIELKNQNRYTLHGALKALHDILTLQYHRVYFFTNRKYFIPGAILSGVVIVISAIVASVVEGLFVSLWLGIWSVGVIYLLKQLFDSWVGTRQGGWPAILSAIFSTVVALPFVISEFFGLSFLARIGSPYLIIILVALVFLNLLFYQLLKAPTRASRSILDQIEGFKLYLTTSDKGSGQHVNTGKVFETNLPFAIALDVEKEWSEKFEKALSLSSTTYTPSWYSGGLWTQFNSIGFASELGSSLSSSLLSASAAPDSHDGTGNGKDTNNGKYKK